MLKHFRKLIYLAIIISSSVVANEQIFMKQAQIASIQSSSSNDSYSLTLMTSGGWQPKDNYYLEKAENCPNPTYAVIYQQLAGYDTLLSIALTARTTKIPVTLVGVCDYHAAYFKVLRIIM